MRIFLQNIRKEFGDFVAIHDFTLEIEEAAFFLLVGSSGSGKSSLLRILSGLELPTRGEIFFDQERVTHKSASARGIGMVFQNYALWPHMTVYENISYALTLSNISASVVNHKVNEVLMITQMKAYKYRYPAELSGGQQQRVALARALAIEPRVLLFDEPLSNLDGRLRGDIREHLLRIQKEMGITIIYVTHNQQEALSMGTQVGVMNAGRLLQVASPRALYNQPNSPFVAQFLGDTNLIQGSVQQLLPSGAIVVQTEWGAIIASNLARSFIEGEAVALSIRPEAIKIDIGKKKLEGDMNIVPATLVKTIYLGEMEKLKLQPDSGGIISVHLFNAPEYVVPIDRAIRCFFKPSKVRVFPLETALL